MKIRGNTVGTTMKPEKVVEKAGGGGGCGSTVIVTVNEHNKASHTSQQIAELLENGHNVLFCNGTYFALDSAKNTVARFSSLDSSRMGDIYEIDENGEIEYFFIDLSEGPAEGAVLYNAPQELTPEEQAQARANIGAAAVGEGGGGGGGGGGGSMVPEFGLLNHYDSYPAWDTTARTFTIPNASRIITSSKVYLNGMNNGNIVLDLTLERGCICYNIDTGAFSVIQHNPTNDNMPESSLLIATYASYGAIVNMASAHRINGDLYGVSTSGAKSNAFLMLASQSGVSLRFDTAQKQVKIYANNIVGGEKNATTPSTIITTLNLYANGVIVFDYTTSTFINRTFASKLTDNQILIATYADYGKKVVNSACCYTVDGYVYGINTDNITAPCKVTSPDYERIPLPDGTPMWSDLIAIGDNIIAFVQSSDEAHTAKDGKIVVMDTNFNVQKTLYHDFGHCNTCHYNANTDTLLIGNLPILMNDPTGIPPALYIFYNVSNWLELAEGTVLEFSTLAPTIIDLMGLKTAYPSATAIAQIAACWGDNNAGENNIVWVSSQFNNWWFKIVLGKGENRYTYGTYTAQTDATKFNGTFNTLEMYTCNKKYQYTEVCQGMDFYNGKPITAEGHNGARVLKWSFNTVSPYAYGKEADWKPFDYVNSATVDVQYNYVYNPDGTILKVATEGVVIKDGYMYIGVFFYDEGNGSKPANSVFSNSVFKYKI